MKNAIPANVPVRHALHVAIPHQIIKRVSQGDDVHIGEQHTIPKLHKSLQY